MTTSSLAASIDETPSSGAVVFFPRISWPAVALWLVLVGAVGGLLSSVSCDESNWTPYLTANVLDTEFEALREYRFRTANDEFLTFTVRLRSAGDGENFEFVLESLNGVSGGQIADPLFSLLQKHLRAGGASRLLFQVDFSIQDGVLLGRNYQVFEVDSDLGLDEPSMRFLAGSRSSDRSHWEVDVGTHSDRPGLLLGYQEFRFDGGDRVVESSMRTLQLQVGNVGAVNAIPNPVVRRERFDSLGDFLDQAEISLLFPRSLPPGFELTILEESVIRTTATLSGQLEEFTYYRMVFSDGIDTLEIVQSLPSAFTSSQRTHDQGFPLNFATVMRAEFLSVEMWSTSVPGLELHIEGAKGTARAKAVLESLYFIR